MRAFIFIGLIFLLAQCAGESSDTNRIPEPMPLEIDGNPEEARVLGEMLFHANFLSKDSSISCATCHIPSHGFADTSDVSMGIHSQAGFRNTPSIYNMAWKTHFFMEGGVTSPDRATLAPMLAEEEMSLQAPELMDRIRSDHSRHEQFLTAFGPDYDYKHVVQALVAFQYYLRSTDSPYDEAIAERDTSMALKRGMDLFFSDRLDCSRCHIPPFFRDTLFHDIGLPVAESPDYGRGRFTFDSADYYHFSTPSLRNASLTAPYMHDGSILTLDSVVKYYETGGLRKPNDLRGGFDLSDDEREDLIFFLRSLTGREAQSLAGSDTLD